MDRGDGPLGCGIGGSDKAWLSRPPGVNASQTLPGTCPATLPTQRRGGRALVLQAVGKAQWT